MTSTSRLFRSSGDKMVSGVSGGLAEYFAVDPVWVRLTWIVLAFLTGGTVILAYLLLWLVLPEDRVQQGGPTHLSADPNPSSGPIRQTLREEARLHLAARRELGPEYEDELVESFVRRLEASQSPSETRSSAPKKTRPSVLAWLLITAGVVILLANLGSSWFYGVSLIPLVLIGLGAAVLVGRRRS